MTSHQRATPILLDEGWFSGIVVRTRREIATVPDKTWPGGFKLWLAAWDPDRIESWDVAYAALPHRTPKRSFSSVVSGMRSPVAMHGNVNAPLSRAFE